MGEKVLVTIELRFTTDDDPEALGERIREATSLIVGRQALEDFRVRVAAARPTEGSSPGPDATGLGDGCDRVHGATPLHRVASRTPLPTGGRRVPCDGGRCAPR